MEQLPETAEKRNSGSPQNLGFVKRQRKSTYPGGRGGRVRREEEGQSIFIHMFYLFDSEGGEDEKEATEEEEAEDTERTVSSAPMGNGAPERILIIVVQRVKLTL